MLIDREAAIDQFRTRAKQHYAEAQSCEDATEETRLGGVYAGLYEAMKIIESLPAIGTCADCAEGHPMFGVVRCARLWGQYLARDGDEGCSTDPTLVDLDWFCAAWRATSKEAKPDAD